MELELSRSEPMVKRYNSIIGSWQAFGKPCHLSHCVIFRGYISVSALRV